MSIYWRPEIDPAAAPPAVAACDVIEDRTRNYRVLSDSDCGLDSGALHARTLSLTLLRRHWHRTVAAVRTSDVQRNNVVVAFTGLFARALVEFSSRTSLVREAIFFSIQFFDPVGTRARRFYLFFFIVYIYSAFLHRSRHIPPLSRRRHLNRRKTSR